MTVPEYSMRSGEIFLKREEKAGKFLFEVFSRGGDSLMEENGFFLRWKGKEG